MIKNIILTSLLLFIFNLPASAVQYLELSYPQKVSVINSPNTYFIGNTNPGSKVYINNVPAKVTEGLFVKVMPLQTGINNFKVKSVKDNLSAEKDFIITVPATEKSLPPKPLAIAPNSVKPGSNTIYSTGDFINVSFKGSPGGNASFSIGNKSVPMTELPPETDTVKMLVLGEVYGRKSEPIAGIYNGVYEVQPGDTFNQTPLKLHLSDGKGNCKSLLASSKITTWKPDAIPTIAEIITDDTAVRTGPGDARLTPLPKGTRLHLTGYSDGYYRYRMSPELEGYISQKNIKILPKGTPIPFSEVRSMSINKTGNQLVTTIPLKTKLPFIVEQSVDQSKLTLFIYGAKADTDIIKYETTDEYIYQVKWSQPYTNVYKLDYYFKNTQQWGYDIQYTGSTTNGNLNLIFKIKYPPQVNSSMPLKDKIIAIDPGHGGWEKGSQGFGLISEKDVNLQISHKLAKILEKQGAKPVLLRTTDIAMGIYDRPDLAAKHNADILLSIHNNAIPDGRDPLIEHGTSCYYYHPMAFPLAETIHNKLLKDLKHPNFGLYYDNLALPREHRMPTILIEIAFMIHPDEYLQLIDENYQLKAADSIANGVKEFFLNTR